MKPKYLILFPILLIACTNTNYANDQQINWCLAKSNTLISYLDGDEFEDMSFGNFYACYGSTAQGSMPNSDSAMPALTLVDACNVLSFKGSSQWGEVYSFSEITVNGSSLTLGWTNDYGEGGSTVITRDDGDCPALK